MNPSTIKTAFLLGFMTLLPTLGMGSASAPDPAAQDLEGIWSVTYVEFSGKRLPELSGSKLTFANGKKTFEMRSGKVETGTYKVKSAADPKEIDTTTDGKWGVQKGIYDIDGIILRMAFSQTGKERPLDFSTKKQSDLLVMVLTKASFGSPVPPVTSPASPAPTAPAPSINERTFRMGFTGYLHEYSLGAFMSRVKFMHEYGDMIAHHMEGVPWAESLNGTAYSKKFMEEWKNKKNLTPKNGKVYVAISPGRGELKQADHSAPIPESLQGKSYNHSLVNKAYLNYVNRTIEYFNPDYLAIGIETNEIYDSNKNAWLAYVDLHKYVYEQVKADHPDLPVFTTLSLHNLFKRRGGELKEFKALMPFNDFVATSYYPFFVESNQSIEALNWLFREFDAFGKPYAMAETNQAAEPTRFPKSGLVLDGSPERQKAYYEEFLRLAQQKRFEFVVSFIHQDYDAIWEQIKSSAPELFIAWKDCGLLDEKGKKRPAFKVWQKYLNMRLA